MSNSQTISEAPAQAKESMVSTLELPTIHVPLYPERYRESRKMSLFEYLAIHKEDMGNDFAQISGQGVTIGRQERPYDFDAIINFKTSNVHHSACINTKVQSTVGMGFLTDEDKQRQADMQLINPGQTRQPSTVVPFTRGVAKAARLLNPLCTGTFQEVLTNVAEDFHQLGNGYIEVVRGRPGSETITGLHHLPARDVWVYVEDQNKNYHYEIQSAQGPLFSRRFARFGDKAGFMSRMMTLPPSFDSPGIDPTGAKIMDSRGVSEVIHVKMPNPLSPWYGFADWLACVPSVELGQCLMQQKYDFFLNRGVPEFMLFFLGAKLDEKDWKEVIKAMKSNIGKGNSHKSLALNLGNVGENFKIKLEKLAMESKGEDAFSSTKETLAMDVVTAHRTPPLLAGILIPGKLGATNELPNALMAYQTLVIGPVQHNFKSKLGDTLGNAAENGGLGLVEDDFAFKTILHTIDVGLMQTTSQMRQTIPEANAQGRDLNQGLRQ